MASHKLWTRKFWRDTAERVVASVAGGALAVVGTDAVGVVDMDWLTVASMAGGAGLVSLLKALSNNASSGRGAGVGGHTNGG